MAGEVPKRFLVKLIGLDPGTAACGYGLVHESGAPQAIDHGCLVHTGRRAPGVAAEDDLRRVRSGRRHTPDALALESRFRRVDPAPHSPSCKLARRARAAAQAGIEWTAYSPSAQAGVCGYFRADRRRCSDVEGHSLAQLCRRRTMRPTARVAIATRSRAVLRWSLRRHLIARLRGSPSARPRTGSSSTSAASGILVARPPSAILKADGAE